MEIISRFNFCPNCGSSQFDPKDFKSDKCENCGFVYYYNPSAAVACFIENCEGELLVVVRKSDPASGTYDLPGGFIDNNETARDAIKREILEETGILTDDPEYLFTLPNIYIYSGFEVHTLDIFFRATCNDLSTAWAGDDAAEVVIIPVRDLDADTFGLESVKEAVRLYKEKFI